MNSPNSEKIMQILAGAWSTRILGAAVRTGIFDALHIKSLSAETVAEKTGMSVNGAQVLLDALKILGFVSLSNGLYKNSADASAFLVKGKPGYIGGMAEIFL